MLLFPFPPLLVPPTHFARVRCGVLDQPPPKRWCFSDSGASEALRESVKRNEEPKKELENVRHRLSEYIIHHFSAAQDI